MRDLKDIDINKYMTLVEFAMDDIQKYIDFKELLIKSERLSEDDAVMLIRKLIKKLD